MRFLKRTPVLVLALMIVPAGLVCGQQPSQPSQPSTGSATPVKADNTPLSHFYEPGTHTISDAKKHELYSEASASYLRSYPKKHPEAAAKMDRLNDYFVASAKNGYAPMGFTTFSGVMDHAIQTGKADTWTAYKILYLVGEEYLESLSQ